MDSVIFKELFKKLNRLFGIMENLRLDILKNLISQKYNWGDSDNWTNFHFNELSLEIEKHTGKKISKETLKRIFGKRKVDSDNYQPQAYSRIALQDFAIYLQSGQKAKVISLKKIYPRKKALVITLILVSIIVAGILLIEFQNSNDAYSFEINTTSDLIPFTTTLKYDVSEMKDSVFVDFGEGHENYLSTDKNIFNYFYKNAGDFKLKIYTRRNILKEYSVIAYSSDWQGGFYPNNKPEEFKSFIDQAFFWKNGFLYTSPEELQDIDVDLKKQVYTSYKYFNKFDKDLDSLIFETRLLNNELTGSYVCYDVGIKLVGEKGNIDFKFTCEKCFRYANVEISERIIDGRYNKLEALTTDMSAWLPIKLKTERNTLRIYLNDELRLEEKYQQLMGKLIGLNIYFYGTGKVDFVKLADNNGKVFYFNDFKN